MTTSADQGNAGLPVRRRYYAFASAFASVVAFLVSVVLTFNSAFANFKETAGQRGGG